MADVAVAVTFFQQELKLCTRITINFIQRGIEACAYAQPVVLGGIEAVHIIIIIAFTFGRDSICTHLQLYIQ